MSVLKCIVIDDKPLAIDILADYIRKTPFLELVTTTTNPLEGLRLINEQEIDLIFLDIQMPELTGLQFLKIAGKKCKVILTTAYTEYALDGYEHDVIDYLLKPISYDRFYRAAEKALAAFGNKIEVKTESEKPKEFLFVKTEHRIQKIDLKEIRYVEALQNYVVICAGNERIMSLQPLKKLEEQLPADEFARVHKSFLVSLRHITQVERSRIYINGQAIPVGDSYREKFYRMME